MAYYLNLDISVLYINLSKSVKISDAYVKIFRYDLNYKRLSLNNGMMIYNQTDYYSKNSYINAESDLKIISFYHSEDYQRIR